MNPKEIMFASCQGMRKTEMARAYFPNVTPENARRNLLRWIAMNPELQERLQQSGYHKEQRYFTPGQVSILYEILGEP